MGRTALEQQFGSIRLRWALAVTLALAALAAVVWVTHARASSPRLPLVAAAPAAATDTLGAALQQRFANECEMVLNQRNFDRAISNCQQFVEISALAGKAHARIAVARTLRESNDPDDQASSSRHAEQAARMGDPMGSMVLAFQGLNGFTTSPLDLDRAQQLLRQAKQGGIANAEVLLDRLKDGQQCREQAKVVLFDLPVFCMGRGELRAAFKAAGLREQERSANTDARDVFAVGDLLPGARQLTLAYARDPRSHLLLPAQLSYRFPAQSAAAESGTVQRLLINLRQKYGLGMAGDTREVLAHWRSPEALDIELRREAGGDLVLAYSHPQRLAIQRELQVVQHQRAAERLSALMLKAL